MKDVESNTHRRAIIELVQETYTNNQLIKNWHKNLLHAVFNELVITNQRDILSWN